MMLTRMTVLAALAIGAAVLPATTATAAEVGASISGTTWEDVNLDGIRQSAEPGLSGKDLPFMSRMVLTGERHQFEARPDHNGDYRFADLPADTYRLWAITRDFLDGYSLTKPGGDSRMDWLTALSEPIVITEASAERVDVGYFKGVGDPALKAAVAPEQIRVGEYVTYEFEVRNLGNAPAYLDTNVTFPAGLIPTAATGGHWLFGPGGGTYGVPNRLLPGQSTVATFTLRAKETVAKGEVTITIQPGHFGDTDPTNNAAVLPLSVTS